MSEEDSALFDDISQEMTNSLRRVLSNGVVRWLSWSACGVLELRVETRR